jgi:hypothetical protein
MKIESYVALHYGADYLPYALRSVAPHVDRIHVVYSPHPSHGTQTRVPPPETRAELHAAATTAGPKVRWHDVNRYYHEGHHRDYALSLCEGSDLALVVDADEVWDGEVLERALRHAYDANHARQWLVNFTTPWRSFSWVVRDNMWPVRIHDFRQAQHRPDGSQSVAYIPKELGPIWHFGYAIRTSILQYKMRCHGHVAEWRPNWFEEKWLPWPPVDDCHPTCERTWYPEPLDRMLLPALMRGHPFWEMEPIE